MLHSTRLKTISLILVAGIIATVGVFSQETTPHTKSAKVQPDWMTDSPTAEQLNPKPTEYSIYTKWRTENLGKMNDTRREMEMHNAILARNPNMEYLFKKYGDISRSGPYRHSMHTREVSRVLQHVNYINWTSPEYLKTLEIKPSDEPETFSLRPQFEKFGIKSIVQNKYGCVLYSNYSQVCFLLAKEGKPKPTLDQYVKLSRDARMLPVSTTAKIVVLEKLGEKKPTTISLPGITDTGREYTHAWAKHFLRKGIPLKARHPYEDHSILVTGFTYDPKTGKTSFEYLDSYGTGVGNGGYFIDTEEVNKKTKSKGDNVATFEAIWFE